MLEEDLKTDYNIIEAKNYLRTRDDIKEYFKEEGYEFFDCGQGYYQDETTEIVYTQDGKFWEVRIIASIGSSKQDRGGRLYYVGYIEDVWLAEIPKPPPKERFSYTFTCYVTEEQRQKIDKYIDKLLKGEND